MHGPSYGGGSSFGGGGSSGGGTSSFGTSSVGSGIGGGFHPAPVMRRSPIFHMFGRAVVLTSWKVVLLTVFIIGILISGLSLYGGVNKYQETDKSIKYYQSDEIGYKELIQKAENGDNGYYKATISNIDFESKLIYNHDGRYYRNCFVYEFYPAGSGLLNPSAHKEVLIANYFLEYDDIVYFQIVYDFEDDGRRVNGLTYACYKENQIGAMSTFSVSYHYQNGETIDSINSDYDLEKCMDYFQTLDDKAESKITIIICSILTAVFVGGIVIFIVLMILKSKKADELEAEKIQAEIDKTNAETEKVKDEISKKNRICEYCGNPIPEGEDVCPSCGSRRHKKISK